LMLESLIERLLFASINQQLFSESLIEWLIFCITDVRFFSLENEHLLALGANNCRQEIDRIACGYFTECVYIQRPEISSQSSQSSYSFWFTTNDIP
jgi:hypothetical protein